MEVRPGYKQTEVGVIPEDWDADNLGRFWGRHRLQTRHCAVRAAGLSAREHQGSSESLR